MNVVRVTVENPDELLNTSAYGAGAIVRLQSGSAEAGPFVNEATAPIVAGTRSYTLYDTDGATSAWYRTRYENAGGTITSDWSEAFQAGAEEAGGICSLYDVKQALNETGAEHDEELAELIGEVTADLAGHTGRRFVRSPLSGTTTVVMDVELGGRCLRVPQGIASLTALEVASESQPETGGTYTTVATTDWMLRPAAHDRLAGWPATEIVIRDNATGAVTEFTAGYNAARLTVALGWDRVPADISGIGRRAVVRRFKNRGAATVNRGGDPTDVMARWTFSLEEWRKINWYRIPVAG